MILAQAEIRAEVARGSIKFDPPLEERQWAEASVNLRLGRKFTSFESNDGVTFSLAKGISSLSSTGVWKEVELTKDKFGERETCLLKPGEFILAVTYERVWIPRHLIGMVEGRSTYARAGLSMHQTAPWLQPGWNGHITLEIRNSGKHKIELTPLVDLPCQVTFLQLTSEVPEKDAYGSKQSHSFQNQTSPLANKVVS